MVRLALLLTLIGSPVAAADTKMVTVAGDDYAVTIAPDPSEALVTATERSTAFTTRSVERAAEVATGCRASVDRKIAMFTGGRVNEPINRNTLENGSVRVRLRC